MLGIFTRSRGSFDPLPLKQPHDYSEIDNIIRVIEVSDAAPFIGPLFQRKFNSPPPNYPRHFISFYIASAQPPLVLGYYHQIPFENNFLAGGLAVDEMAYRRICPEHRKIIKQSGGIAEHLSIRTFQLLGDKVDGIWGYVGNRQARDVDERVGFESVGYKNVMVVWRNGALSESRKKDITRKIIQLPPF